MWKLNALKHFFGQKLTSSKFGFNYQKGQGVLFDSDPEKHQDLFDN